MIDPQDYAEIVAKRPELRVQHHRCPLEYQLEPMPSSPGWWVWVQYITGRGNHWDEYVSPQRAEDMIGWHWTRMLPYGYGLFKCTNEEHWTVWDAEESTKAIGWHPDPLSALTVFWRSQ